MMQKGDTFEGTHSSTNASLASSNSDYQNAYIATGANTGTSSPAFADGAFDTEVASRPLSRNSTTSCLSTTATKDGIEGKKHHRHGHTPYFANILTNMLQQQQLNLHDSPHEAPDSPDLRHDDTYSSVSAPPKPAAGHR